MAVQAFVLDADSIKKILAETKQQLRPCQLKDYSIHARILPSGYVFANMYEHPDSFAAIMQVAGCPLIKKDAVPQNLAAFLQQNGYSETRDDGVLLCDTQGALELVSATTFKALFHIDSTIPRSNIQEYLAADWRLVSRRGEKVPMAQGFVVPVKYVGLVKSPRNTMLAFNHAAVPNHGVGDVIILQKGGIMYPVNNALFGNTYNLNVGGWAQSGLITRTAQTLPLTTDRLKKLLKI